ncbi:hypothetical protein O181_123315 [Austropuccinia psidii MF-1]|uniref:Uncharacterized protein n=1 Tax=Austropuccinia psidii MF-1 TaxID=1389203 RepID=A0A9Q3KQX4_9BASI|nr:hypothetical protein [Austropuccinia psidii MF-1]
MPLIPLTILTLMECLPNILQHGLPSLHLYSAHPTCRHCCLPSLWSRCPPNMPPMLPSHWPNPQGFLLSLRSCSPLKMRLRCHPPTPTLSSPLLPILTLPRRPQDMPPMPPSTPHMPNPLSAAYHPYAKVLDP